jgi:hypothetical protein
LWCSSHGVGGERQEKEIRVNRWIQTAAIVGIVAGIGMTDLRAQEPLEVGTVAPSFALVGATRDGVLPDTVHLSDFAGKTVVLAFFYRVRTPG